MEKASLTLQEQQPSTQLSCDFTAAQSDDLSELFNNEKAVLFATDYSSSSISIIDTTTGVMTKDVNTFSISDIELVGQRRTFLY